MRRRPRELPSLGEVLAVIGVFVVIVVLCGVALVLM